MPMTPVFSRVRWFFDLADCLVPSLAVGGPTTIEADAYSCVLLPFQHRRAFALHVFDALLFDAYMPRCAGSTPLLLANPPSWALVIFFVLNLLYLMLID